MHQFEVKTRTRNEMVEITDHVRSAVKASGVREGLCVVYCSHTTAAITINEKIDPVLVEDLERGFEKLVGEDWGWRHDDKDGPNVVQEAG